MKRLLLLFILLFTVFYTYTAIAQEIGSIRKQSDINLPEKIQGPLGDPLPAGTYSIGSAGYFPTIDSAFNKLSIDGIAGNVTLELIDELYTATTSQYGFLLNGPIPGAGPNSRVTIKPAENKNVIVEGNGEGIFHFNNTSYLILDGVGISGATTLTVHNLVTTPVLYNDAITFVGNCDHNVVQNTIAITEDITRVNCGVVFWPETNVIGTPDSNLIQNNFIQKATFGFYIGANLFQTSKASGNIIKGNMIGSETDSLITFGIQAERVQNTIIEDNIVQNITRQAIVGINDFCYGINVYAGNETIIRNNVVYDINSSSGVGATGILLSGAGSMNNLVYNNMVYDIQSSSVNFDSRVTGIQLFEQNSPKIYYNSVYLFGQGDGANPLGSAALFVYGGFGNSINLDLKNNIFVNTRDEGQYCASAIYDYTASNLTSDYNDLYYDDTNNNNCLVRIGSTNYNTLGDWQATGKDLNSITEMPHFTSSTDLHIDKTYPTNLERGATPIASITTDYDGDLRNVTTPDIGADEFDGFTFEDPLPAGTYTIGTGGNFASIQDAFNKLETDGVAGNVTLELIDELYTAPTDSFGFKLNGPIPGAGSNSRVTIKPAENENVVIEGNGLAVLSFINTSYLTFDGVSITGSTSISIHALYNNQFQWNNGLLFLDDSDHNIIQNCIFIDEDILRLSVGLGIYTDSNIPEASDSNLIQFNYVKQAGIGIYVSSYRSTVRATGNIIRANIIGSETDSLISWGIQIEENQNTIIEDNVVHSIRGASSAFVITHGINCYACLGSVIRNNIVHNVYTSYTGGSMGIALTGDGNGNTIYNNMIYDINSSSSASQSNIGGIHLESQNNTKIYYNSVYLYGAGANQQGSGALYIWTPGFNTEAKNNIFVNTRDEGQFCASAIHLKTLNIILSSSDFNVLNYEPNNYNCLVKSNSGSYHSLTEWQATGYDLHSYVEMPHFVEPYLHIDSTVATYLEARGTPIAGIDTDIDGQSRNALTPDIGADEFDGIVGVEDEETLPTEFALEQNYPNPFNPSTVISYQLPVSGDVKLKVYDILGNEVATLVNEYKPAGRYEFEFSGSAIPSGVYFYQLKAGDFISTKKMILLK